MNLNNTCNCTGKKPCENLNQCYICRCQMGLLIKMLNLSGKGTETKKELRHHASMFRMLIEWFSLVIFIANFLSFPYFNWFVTNSENYWSIIYALCISVIKRLTHLVFVILLFPIAITFTITIITDSVSRILLMIKHQELAKCLNKFLLRTWGAMMTLLILVTSNFWMSVKCATKHDLQKEEGTYPMCTNCKDQFTSVSHDARKKRAASDRSSYVSKKSKK